MSETPFRIFSGCFELGADLLHAVCLTVFYKPFLPKTGHHGRKLLFIFSSYLIIDRLCGLPGTPQGISGLLLTVLLTAAYRILGLERAMAFLLALLYGNTRISSALIAESLYFIADRQWSLPPREASAFFLRSAVLLTGLLLSHAVLLAVMLYILRRRIAGHPMPLHRRELCFIALLPTAGILFGQMISRLLFETQNGILLQLYERHPVFLATVPLLAFLFYAGAYLSIAFQQGMAVLREEQAAGFVERQQAQAIRARIREMEQYYTRIRQLKHDLRGHLANIRGLARSGSYTGLDSYIAKMDESIGDLELALRTGDPVTDVIVNDKRQQCLDRGIRFQTDFHYPDPERYDAFDVGIILQNPLQNALEACENAAEGERFISLSGKKKGNFFLIKVENSFSGKVIWGPDGLPVSSKKEEPSMHGIGLSSVRRTAEKYLGCLKFDPDGRVFRVTVMVQEKQNHDQRRNASCQS